YLDAKVSVIRERSIVDGFEERLTILNHAEEPAGMAVRIDADADFRPLTGIAQHTPQVGRLYQRAEHGSLRLGYPWEKFRRETAITTPEPAHVDRDGLTYTILIDPQGQWTTTLNISSHVLRPDGEDVRDHLSGHRKRDEAELEQDLEQWLDKAPQLN